MPNKTILRRLRPNEIIRVGDLQWYDGNEKKKQWIIESNFQVDDKDKVVGQTVAQAHKDGCTNFFFRKTK
jgi:hypothetical protein